MAKGALCVGCSFIAVVTVLVAVLLATVFPDEMPPLLPGEVPAESNRTMHAVFYDESGDVDVLQFSHNFSMPSRPAGYVRVRIHYASINPVDYELRSHPVPNLLRPSPFIPGVDIAGVVESADVDADFQAGDRVMGHTYLTGTQWGGYAEYISVPGSILAKVDDDVSLKTAAAVPLAGLTFYQAFQKMIAHFGGLEACEGKTILIHAGAGGVGHLAIQYAKNVLKMKVFTTASAKNAPFLEALGATVIDYTQNKFEEVLPEPVDAVLDCIGGDYEDVSLVTHSRVIKNTGIYMSILNSARERQYGQLLMGPAVIYHSLRHAVRGALSIGPKFTYVCVRPDGQGLAELSKLLTQKILQPHVSKVFDINEAKEAHSHLEKRHTVGKVVLRITSPSITHPVAVSSPVSEPVDCDVAVE